jgi:hypothetical protein
MRDVGSSSVLLGSLPLIGTVSTRSNSVVQFGHATACAQVKSVWPNHAFNRTRRYGPSIWRTSVAAGRLTWFRWAPSSWLRCVLTWSVGVNPRTRFGAAVPSVNNCLAPCGGIHSQRIGFAVVRRTSASPSRQAWSSRMRRVTVAAKFWHSGNVPSSIFPVAQPRVQPDPPVRAFFLASVGGGGPVNLVSLGPEGQGSAANGCARTF